MAIWDVVTNPATRSVFYGLDNAEASMFAECTRKGNKYTMNIRYYVQDYYDYNKEDTTGAVLNVKICDMAWLHDYGYARNFEIEGIAEFTEIKWTIS